MGVTRSNGYKHASDAWHLPGTAAVRDKRVPWQSDTAVFGDDQNQYY
ncbi:hypothetical protein D3OALGA1CA_537 [Olavius algarvensis associated proteobacterium Delta 3]|nr:hypothetical protein D3OALGA1CA_537 [Olavius algarvensis associated proteobacterium Delta 3]CAB5138753.1 hypothetical protein D3OALGB2SA_4098 [Olavius algarvensis associated proteobacterium Delta 3]